jgi:phosphoglycolate phosphatase-like HAD superfamily hydrolase
VRIVLFDIDGTLISTKGGGKRAMQSALIRHFGTRGADGYRYDGKTDRQIARELMRGEGFTDDEIDARMQAVIDDYLEGLRREMSAGATAVKVHRGIPQLLDVLEQRSDVVLGLLTGNIEPGARVKLDAASLRPHRFRVGAFGSDHEKRDELPAIARARASALLERDIDGEALVIIGDTPNDIHCGRGVCARAIAVATGGYSVDALAEHSPAAVFGDLSDTDRVVDAILSAPAHDAPAAPTAPGR